MSPTIYPGTVPALGTTYFGGVGGLPTRGYRILSQSQSLTCASQASRTLQATQSQSLNRAGRRGGQVLIEALQQAASSIANPVLPGVPAVGNVLTLVFGCWYNGNWINAVSGGGVTSWVKVVADPGLPSGAGEVEIWYGVVTAPGSPTITVTTQNAFHYDVVVTEWSGMQTTGASASAHGNHTGTDIQPDTPTITPTQDGSLILAAGSFQFQDNGAYTNGFARLSAPFRTTANGYSDAAYLRQLSAALIGTEFTVAAKGNFDTVIASFSPGTLGRTFLRTQSQSLARARALARSLPRTQTQAAKIVRSRGWAQAIAGSQAVAVVGEVGRALALTQSQAAGLAAVTARIIALAHDETPSRSSSIACAVVQTQTAQPSLVAAPASTTLSATQAAAVALDGRVSARALAATQAASLTLARSAAQSLSLVQGGAAGTSSSIARAVAQTQAGEGSIGSPPASMMLSATQAAGVTLAERAIAQSFVAAQAAAASLRSGVSRALTAAHSASAALVRGMAGVQAIAQGSGLTTARAHVGALSAAQAQAAGVQGALTGARTGSQTTSVSVTYAIAGSRALSQAQSAVLAAPVVHPPHLLTLTQAQAQTTLLGRRAGSALSATQTQDLQTRAQARRAITSAQVSAPGLGRRDGLHQLRLAQSQTPTRPMLLVRRTIVAQAALAQVYSVKAGGLILASGQGQTVGLGPAATSKLLSIAQSSSLGLRRPVVNSWSLTQAQVVIRVPRLKKGLLSVEVLNSTVLNMAVVSSVRGEASARGSILDETAHPELLATALSSDLRSEEA